MSRLRVVAIALVVAASACSKSTPPDVVPEGAATPQATAAPTASASATTVAAPSASASASATATTPTDALAPFEGTWDAQYTAKKGSVAVPSGVKDKARDADKGDVATGPGKIVVVVASDGAVTGSVTGALGRASVSGKVDAEPERTILRATVTPQDPANRDAMTGVVVAVLKGDVFAAELHVAGPDATVVREATFELHRKAATAR